MNYIRLLRSFVRLRSNVKKSRAEIEAIQEYKLKKLLAHAWDYSPYYRRSFEHAGITREQLPLLPLSAFPAIDKSTLMEHYNELVTVPELNQEALRAFDEKEKERQALFLGKYHVVHSSGSTGTPCYFVYEEDAWNQMLVSIIRGALWDMSPVQIARLLLRGPRIVYVAATDGRYGGAMAVGDGMEGLHAKQLFLDINMPLTEWSRKIKNFRPDMIIGYPSAIKILADLAERGAIQVTIQRIISCGEPLDSGVRHYLETAFQTDVVNFYGAGESLALGVETSPAEGMYLFDDMNCIEIVNGAMYLTSLYNFAQPLIRYRISDRLSLKACGGQRRYPFTRAEHISGRDEDLLWFEDGAGRRDFLHPLAVEGFCIPGLLDYQFRRIGPDSFEMLAETADSRARERIRTELSKRMKTILLEKHLDYVQFFVRFTDQIPPDARTGKKRLILRPDSEVRPAV